MNSPQRIASFFTVILLLLICSSISFSEPPSQIGYVVDLIQAKNKQCELKEFPCTCLGRHIIAEFTGCTHLNDSEILEPVLREAAVAAGATVLSVTVHTFEPFGMTGVAVLQESHISVHTWPEYGYVSIDIYTCGERLRLDEALKVLKDFFLPKKVQAVSITRGFENSEYIPSDIDEEYRLL